MMLHSDLLAWEELFSHTSQAPQNLGARKRYFGNTSPGWLPLTRTSPSKKRGMALGHRGLIRYEQEALKSLFVSLSHSTVL